MLCIGAVWLSCAYLCKCVPTQPWTKEILRLGVRITIHTNLCALSTCGLLPVLCLVAADISAEWHPIWASGDSQGVWDLSARGVNCGDPWWLELEPEMRDPFLYPTVHHHWRLRAVLQVSKWSCSPLHSPCICRLQFVFVCMYVL